MFRKFTFGETFLAPVLTFRSATEAGFRAVEEFFGPGMNAGDPDRVARGGRPRRRVNLEVGPEPAAHDVFVPDDGRADHLGQDRQAFGARDEILPILAGKRPGGALAE